MSTDILDLPTEHLWAAAAGQTIFTFAFRLFDKDDLIVTVDGVPAVYSATPTLATEYLIATDYINEGGTIAFGAGLLAGQQVAIARVIPRERVTRFPDSGPVPMAAINREFDRGVSMIQDLNTQMKRSLLASAGQVVPPLAIEKIEDGQLLGLINGEVVGVDDDTASAVDSAAKALAAEVAAAAALTAVSVQRAAVDEAANTATAAAARAAAAVLAGSAPYYPAARGNVPRGAFGVGAITPGSGGTNGTFVLAFTGGNFAVNPTGTFTVAGGIVTAINITGRGLYIGGAPVAPTLDFAASAGLTGAAAALNVDFIVGAGGYYFTDHATLTDTIALFQNVAGAATEVDPLVDWLNVAAARANFEAAKAFNQVQPAPVTIGYRGDLSLATPTSNMSTKNNIVMPDRFPLGGTVDIVRVISFSGSGTLAVRSYTRTNSGQFDVYAEKTVTVTAGGLFTVANLGLAVPPMGYVGFSGNAAVGVISASGGPALFNGGTNTGAGNYGLTSFTDSAFDAFNQYAFQAVLTPPVQVRSKADDDARIRTLTKRTLGDKLMTGATGQAGTPNWRIDPQTFPLGGTFDTLDVHMWTAGYPVVASISESGGKLNYHAMRVLNYCAAGLNLAVPVGIDIPAGGRVAVFNAGVALRGTDTQWPQGLLNTLTTGGVNYTIDDLPTPAINRGGFPNLARFDCTEIMAENAPATAQLVADKARNLVGPRAVHMLSVLGQSNAAGNEPGVTLRAAFGNLSFYNSTTALVPARLPEAGQTISGVTKANEFPGLGAAEAFRLFGGDDGYFDNNNLAAPIIAGHSALGSTALFDLMRGTTMYDQAIAQIAAGKTFADAQGLPFVYVGSGLFQGERDAEVGTSRATYKNTLKVMAENVDVDSRRVAPGGWNRTIACVQICSKGIDAGWEIAMAQLEASRESDLVTIALPEYFLPFGDALHVSGPGIRIAGAYIARALYAHAVHRKRFAPLQVIDSYVSGGDVVLVFNRPALAFDTVTIPAQAKYGFRLWDAANAEVTAGITVAISGRTVRLTPATAPAAGWKWAYCRTPAVGIGSTSGPAYGGFAGNLRASASWGSFDGQTLYDWAVAQEGTL